MDVRALNSQKKLKQTHGYNIAVSLLQYKFITS